METHPHARARVRCGWGGGMDRRGRRKRDVGPLGLLPAPIVPCPFAILFRAAGCRLGYAAASFPSRRRVRSLASPWYGRVCTRVRYVRHVSRTSCPRLRLLLHQRVRRPPPRRPVSYICERLLRRSRSYQLCVIRLRGVSRRRHLRARRRRRAPCRRLYLRAYRRYVHVPAYRPCPEVTARQFSSVHFHAEAPRTPQRAPFGARQDASTRHGRTLQLR